MLDPVSVWTQEFANLPLVEDSSWAQNFADLLDSLTTGKLAITGITPESTFTFSPGTFQGIAVTALPAPPPSGADILSQAFQAAVLASTMLIPAGAAIGAPTPATTFSAPVTAVLDPSAGALILKNGILAAQPTADASQSTVAAAFHAAFSAVLASATGLNSLPPPSGPTPLILPPTPLN